MSVGNVGKRGNNGLTRGHIPELKTSQASNKDARLVHARRAHDHDRVVVLVQYELQGILDEVIADGLPGYVRTPRFQPLVALDAPRVNTSHMHSMGRSYESDRRLVDELLQPRQFRRQVQDRSQLQALDEREIVGAERIAPVDAVLDDAECGRRLHCQRVANTRRGRRHPGALPRTSLSRSGAASGVDSCRAAHRCAVVAPWS